MGSKPHILFVPGAWHRATAWQAVRQRLEQDGFETSAVDLPSNDPDQAAESKNFPEDVASVRSALDALIHTRGKTVVAVLHSYGGLVGSEALLEGDRANGNSGGGVKAIVYVNAFMLPKGLTSPGVLAANPGSQNKHDYKDGHIFVTNPAEAFFNDLPIDEAEVNAANLVGIGASVFSTIELTSDVYLGLPLTYVTGEDDNSIKPEAQQSMIEKARDSGAKIAARRLKSGHDPMISRPDDLVQIIKDAIESS